jgi:iron complex outermembrane receptor protein
MSTKNSDCRSAQSASRPGESTIAAPSKALRGANTLRWRIFGFLLGPIALSTALGQGLPSGSSSSSDQSAAGALQEITVTGTHLAISSYESPTPLTTVTSEDLNNRGVANFADYLSYLPAFEATNNPQTTTLWSLKNGSTFNDLRGLGPNRTLTLLDGERFVPTATDGTLDMNVFPTALIERIDIVTGGASAAYGSDAIAGVVNVITNKDFTGVKGDVQYGETQYSDNRTTSGSFAAGSTLLDNRAHILASVDFERVSGLATQNDRPWGRAAPCIVNNPSYGAKGASEYIIGYNCTLSTATTGGLINSPGPLAGIQFGPGGTLQRFAQGADYSAASPFMSGGSGANMGADRPISVPYDRHSEYGSFRYSLTDTIELFANGILSHSNGESPTAQQWDFGSITIQANNAYLPAPLRTLMAADGLSSFTMSRVNTDMGFYAADSTFDVTRYVVGIQGDNLGWKWSAYAQRGETDYTNLQINNRIQQNFTNAVNAVVDPSNGKIVCAATLTGGAPGCVPVDLFGYGSPSAAADAYIHGTEFYQSIIVETAGAATASTSVPTLPSGPLELALGAEYRDESANGNSDPLAASGGYTVASPLLPTVGSYHVNEQYIEVAQPLLKDFPLAKLLEFNGAYRYAEYSTAGGAKAWKLGVSYFPFSPIQLRGLISQDVRAPNLNELFSPPGGLAFATISDPKTNSSYVVDESFGGNRSLKVETAKTRSFGVVYKPEWADGLAVSVDYWDIRVADEIGTLEPQQIIDFCEAGDSQACAAITRGSGGLITTVASTEFNISSERHTGVDFQSTYVRPLGTFFGRTAHLTLNLTGTYTDHWLLSPDGSSSQELAGQVGANVSGSGVPKWRANFTADYAVGAAGVNARIRYVGGGQYLNTWNTTIFAENNIPSVTYLDLSGRYRIINDNQHQHQLEIYGGIDNVFNTSPPVNPENFFITGFTNFELYDVLGRRFYAGLRFKF